MMPMIDSPTISGTKSRVASGRIGRLKRMKPYVPIFSRTAARITEPAVGASVWASGSQVWNGNIGTLTAKPRKNARKIHFCSVGGHGRARWNAVMSNVYGCRRDGVAVEVEREDAEQHHHAADQRVDEELDRRVEPAAAAPDADEEVHRHQHHFPEQEEQEEVERRRTRRACPSAGPAGRCSTPSRAR